MTRQFFRNPKVWGGAFVLSLILAAGALFLLVGAQPVQATTPSTTSLVAIVSQADNASCLACHNQPDQILTFENGDTLSISISAEAYGGSVHGGQGMACTTCHINISGYPHPDRTSQTRREYQFQYQNSCKTCHPEQFSQTQDSIHGQALGAGNKAAPLCVDCHNPHTQGEVHDVNGKLLQSERAKIPQTCRVCHSAIYDKYAASVHGSAVLAENNPDVPTCIDCHGVHMISDPNTPTARLTSVQMCSKCHTDKTIMDKYGLSTEVLNTYIADFHGTTVTLFQKTEPDQQTNKPVCYDCHGIHDIRSTSDPERGLQIKENVLVACKRCHPDATTNFPDSWLSHYIPSREKAPLVYYINLIYQILIPVVIGGMLIFVLADAYRRIRTRGHKPADSEK